MNSRLFETFRETLDNLPPEEVLKAVAAERCQLEQDLIQHRILPGEDSDSILAFCRFLAGAAFGSMVWPDTMPIDHWTFYVKTVKRLVEAEQLPFTVRRDIEAAFHGVFCCIMA